jgi:hypothetical protein
MIVFLSAGCSTFLLNEYIHGQESGTKDFIKNG